MTVPFVVSLFLAWTLLPSNVAGRSKKTIISSATFASYCVGNIIGSQIFQAKDAPHYIPGLLGCCICFGLEAIVIISWRLWYVYQNRKRDREALAMGWTEEDIARLGQELGAADVTGMYLNFSGRVAKRVGRSMDIISALSHTLASHVMILSDCQNPHFRYTM